jgi:hypothetical protein
LHLRADHPVLNALIGLMILYDYSQDDYSQKWRSIMTGTASKKRPPRSKRRAAEQPAFTRAPVLSKAALAYAKKLEGNRELAIEFLKEAGIIERPGKLARPYR